MPITNLDLETRRRIADAIEQAVANGLPAEQAMQALDEFESKSDDILPPSSPPLGGFPFNIASDIVAPTPANLVALPLSFVTGPAASRLVPATSAVKSLLVKFAANPKIWQEVAATEATRRGLATASSPILSIVEEPTVLKRLAFSFGMSLPFSALDAAEAIHDDSGTRSPVGAFAETTAFFLAMDAALSGGFGLVGRAISRAFGTRIADRTVQAMYERSGLRILNWEKLSPDDKAKRLFEAMKAHADGTPLPDVEVQPPPNVTGPRDLDPATRTKFEDLVGAEAKAASRAAATQSLRDRIVSAAEKKAQAEAASRAATRRLTSGPVASPADMRPADLASHLDLLDRPSPAPVDEFGRPTGPLPLPAHIDDALSRIAFSRSQAAAESELARRKKIELEGGINPGSPPRMMDRPLDELTEFERVRDERTWAAGQLGRPPEEVMVDDTYIYTNLVASGTPEGQAARKAWLAQAAADETAKATKVALKTMSKEERATLQAAVKQAKAAGHIGPSPVQQNLAAILDPPPLAPEHPVNAVPQVDNAPVPALTPDTPPTPTVEPVPGAVVAANRVLEVVESETSGDLKVGMVLEIRKNRNPEHWGKTVEIVRIEKGGPRELDTIILKTDRGEQRWSPNVVRKFTKQAATTATEARLTPKPSVEPASSHEIAIARKIEELRALGRDENPRQSAATLGRRPKDAESVPFDRGPNLPPVPKRVAAEAGRQFPAYTRRTDAEDLAFGPSVLADAPPKEDLGKVATIINPKRPLKVNVPPNTPSVTFVADQVYVIDPQTHKLKIRNVVATRYVDPDTGRVVYAANIYSPSELKIRHDAVPGRTPAELEAVVNDFRATLLRGKYGHMSDHQFASAMGRLFETEKLGEESRVITAQMWRRVARGSKQGISPFGRQSPIRKVGSATVANRETGAALDLGNLRAGRSVEVTQTADSPLDIVLAAEAGDEEARFVLQAASSPPITPALDATPAAAALPGPVLEAPLGSIVADLARAFGEARAAYSKKISDTAHDALIDKITSAFEAVRARFKQQLDLRFELVRDEVQDRTVAAIRRADGSVVAHVPLEDPLFLESRFNALEANPEKIIDLDLSGSTGNTPPSGPC